MTTPSKVQIAGRAAVEQAHAQFGDPNEPAVLQYLRGLSATWRSRPNDKIRRKDAADCLDTAIDHLTRNRWIMDGK